jgi:RNA polymerase sigma-70 factor (ECF subfamily)
VGQEVFRALVRTIARFRRDGPGDSFRAWLATVTRNKIRDHWRKRRSEPEAFGGTAAQERLAREPAERLEESVSAGGTEGAADLGSAGHRALDLIRAEFGEKTWLAFWRVSVDRKTPAEAAAELGMSTNAVYLAKSRVLRRLRTEFGDLLG